jgi:hypothetical protein
LPKEVKVKQIINRRAAFEVELNKLRMIWQEDHRFSRRFDLKTILSKLIYASVHTPPLPKGMLRKAANYTNTVRFICILVIFLFLGLVPSHVYGSNSIPISIEYAALKEDINQRQKQFQTQHQMAVTDNEKNKVLTSAREYILDIMVKDLFPAWYGTRWTYNGHTRIPGQDSIACGTFVIYTLQDVGFEVPSKMARQPSENIIKNIAGPSVIKRFWNGATMERIVKWIKEEGEGIYIVGLDIHVGFVIYLNGEITFCHSSYYDSLLQVVNQDILEKSPLTDSQYRVFGKLFNPEMMIKWIKSEQFAIEYNYFNR